MSLEIMENEAFFSVSLRLICRLGVGEVCRSVEWKSDRSENKVAKNLFMGHGI